MLTKIDLSSRASPKHLDSPFVSTTCVPEEFLILTFVGENVPSMKNFSSENIVTDEQLSSTESKLTPAKSFPKVEKQNILKSLTPTSAKQMLAAIIEDECISSCKVSTVAAATSTAEIGSQLNFAACSRRYFLAAALSVQRYLPPDSNQCSPPQATHFGTLFGFVPN